VFDDIHKYYLYIEVLYIQYNCTTCHTISRIMCTTGVMVVCIVVGLYIPTYIILVIVYKHNGNVLLKCNEIHFILPTVCLFRLIFVMKPDYVNIEHNLLIIKMQSLRVYCVVRNECVAVGSAHRLIMSSFESQKFSTLRRIVVCILVLTLDLNER
jgi:hypothetical protein